MLKYSYQGKTYPDLMALRGKNPHLVFPPRPDDEILENLGISLVEVIGGPTPEEIAKRELELKIARVDEETSAAILAGFDYEIDGRKLHFSYDSFDQQNFADSATAAVLAANGVAGVPQSIVWNAYDNGELVQVTMNPNGFLELYITGALAHKKSCMEEGGRKKAALNGQVYPEAPRQTEAESEPVEADQQAENQAALPEAAESAEA